MVTVTVKMRSRSLSGGVWYVGTVGTYYFEALVFSEPSKYGIDGGQVSKLLILDKSRRQGGKELACYERGWEVRPENAEVSFEIDWRTVQEAVRVVVDETSRMERERQ